MRANLVLDRDPVVARSLRLALSFDVGCKPLLGQFGDGRHRSLSCPALGWGCTILDGSDDALGLLARALHRQPSGAVFADRLEVALPIAVLAHEVDGPRTLPAHAEARLLGVHDGLAGCKSLDQLGGNPGFWNVLLITAPVAFAPRTPDGLRSANSSANACEAQWGRLSMYVCIAGD